MIVEETEDENIFNKSSSTDMNQMPESAGTPKIRGSKHRRNKSYADTFNMSK